MQNNKLSLHKAYDYCATKTPRLTVVLIHGIASDSSTYNGVLAYFKQADSLRNVRFVAFDLLGSGKSQKSDELNYDYHDQLEALHNSIDALNIETPLVLVGHSLGTFIVTRYADTFKNTIKSLILISPPIYTEADFNNPAFELGIKAFKDAVSLNNHDILKEKSFNNSMSEIVLDRSNYRKLANIKTPTTLVYGNRDQIIAAYNIPQLLKDNPEITATKTVGGHGITHEKYGKIQKVLEEVLSA